MPPLRPATTLSPSTKSQSRKYDSPSEQINHQTKHKRWAKPVNLTSTKAHEKESNSFPDQDFVCVPTNHQGLHRKQTHPRSTSSQQHDPTPAPRTPAPKANTREKRKVTPFLIRKNCIYKPVRKPVPSSSSSDSSDDELGPPSLPCEAPPQVPHNTPAKLR